MLDAKELNCFAVGKNEWVIRRTFRDEQGRRCHQFLAHIANATTNNQEVAEEFIKGIAALQELSGLTPLVADGAYCDCPFGEFRPSIKNPKVCYSCGRPAANANR